MQRNDVLTKTASWRNITDEKAVGASRSESAFSIYYSLDLSVPFFLRKNTNLSSFLSLYRQGLVRVSFDKVSAAGANFVNISLNLVPGSGSGITLVNSIAIETGERLSNRVYGAGGGENGRIFISAGNSVISVNISDNTIREFSGQGQLWIIPVEGDASGRDVNAWIVSEIGRVTLVNADLEPIQGFPVLTGVRISSQPMSYNGRLYLCDEDGKVHAIDTNGKQSTWETAFVAAVRSPPSFLTVSSGNQRRTQSDTRTYAAVYPKSFFGEIWLLDENGKALPNWPAPITIDEDGYNANSGIGFGSPLLFAHNNNIRVAFICQAGNLFVYDEGAAPVPPFPLSIDGTFFIQPVFDGEFLWLVSAEGALFRVNLYGEVLSQQITGFSAKEEGYITAFDYDGDKIPEIFFTGEGNALYAFTRNFRSVTGFPLPAWGRPHFAEARGSGQKAGIYATGMDKRLYFWRFK
jgi:hypothetical protein